MADENYESPNRQGAYGSSYISNRNYRQTSANAANANAVNGDVNAHYAANDEEYNHYGGDNHYYDETQNDENQYSDNQGHYSAEQGQYYDPSLQYTQAESNAYTNGQANWHQAQNSSEYAAAPNSHPGFTSSYTNAPAWTGPTIIPSGVTECDTRFLSLSCAAFPSTTAVRTRAAVPLALSIHPLADVEIVEPHPAAIASCVERSHPSEGPLPVVNFGNTGVVRCKACRAYISPYMQWQDGGSRWRCCLCGRTNDCPNAYMGELDRSNPGSRVDRQSHVELSLSSFEIIAPSEYMVRPPQPPVFIFVIDVSYEAVRSGAVERICAGIQHALFTLDTFKRAKFALVTFSSTVHLHTFRDGQKRPEMLVMPNLDDLFLPSPDDFVATLSEARQLIEFLLQVLPSLHTQTKDPESAFGAAVLSSYRIGCAVGGKVLFFASGLPSIGPARLKNREHGSTANKNTPEELLQPSTEFYSHWAVKFTRVQLSADIFVFAQQFCDVATLSNLCENSGGQLYYYNHFDAEIHGTAFQADLLRCLTREQSWEAVMRVRVSTGAKITGYHGNFFLRGQDLLSIPNCTADTSVSVELANDPDHAAQDIIYIQAALLYTTSFGERRIRVHNCAIPVITEPEQLFAYVDIPNMITFTAKKALTLILQKSLASGREYIQNVCVAILSAWRKTFNSFTPLSCYEEYPESLAMLPLMTLGLLKHPSFSDTSSILSDERTFLLAFIRQMGVKHIEMLFRPRIMPVHFMSGDEGIAHEYDMMMLPQEINLTMDEVADDGAYLVDNGIVFYLWLGPYATTSPAPYTTSIFFIAHSIIIAQCVLSIFALLLRHQLRS